MLLRVFQRQVEFQCLAILAAGDQLQNALRTADSPGAWMAIQNLLNAAANISKALWGQGCKFATEREPLRASIQVDDTSPLKGAAMRNNFEHFDERLDNWWKESKNHNYVDMNIDVSVSVPMSATRIEMFRNFDPNTGELTFWSQTFNVSDLLNEAERLLPLVSTEAAKPHWDPPNSGGSGQPHMPS
jgi:hypothetical protein